MKSVLEYLTKPKGVYVGVKYKGKEIDNIKKLFKIQNNHNDYHCTIIYSTKYDDVIIDDRTYKATISRIHAFNKDFLVAVLDCPELNARHKELMDKYNLTYDYDEYIPHITLSYDMSNEDLFDKGVIDLSEEDFKKAYGIITLELCCEYVEELNPNYI